MSGNYLSSWGRYPKTEQIGYDCSWQSDLKKTADRLVRSNENTLVYGNGRSYGDSCLSASGHVLHTRFLNKFISVSWETGIIVAESGVTLEDILKLSIPKGWFLPVTPGTKYVTLGGAVANDVHGKNHHVRGTFGRHVKQFGLLCSSHETEITCSLDENSELFKATIGGLGLTGIITWVELQLMPIKSSHVNVTYQRFNNLSEFFALSDELDHQHEYAVSWIDCVAKGNALGRGIYAVGNHALEGPLSTQEKKKITVPFSPSFSLINKASLKLFNQFYYSRCPFERHKKLESYDEFFYPLDGILNWNRIYGSRGFQQFQCIVPNQDAERTIDALLKTIAKKQMGSFLAVLKRCGDLTSPGLLSFPMPGISLALDFPQTNALSELFNELDNIVAEAGGRLYPAKDAHMSAQHFKQFYPQWETLEKYRDPALCSQFWKRVTLS